MKQFNIAHSNFKLNNIIMPINAVYGCYSASWGKRLHVSTNVSRVTHDRLSAPIYYMVDNFTQHIIIDKNGNKHIHYNIHVFDTKREKWYHNVDTNSPKYYALADFLTRLFEKNNIASHTKCVYGGVAGGLEIPYTMGSAAEKRAQIFDPNIGIASVGYALNPHVTTSGYNGWSAYETPVKCSNNKRVIL